MGGGGGKGIMKLGFSQKLRGGDKHKAGEALEKMSKL